MQTESTLRPQDISSRALNTLHGHYWTYAGWVLSKVTTISVVDAPVTIDVEDEVSGRFQLDARWHDAKSDACVVVFHGLGGSLESRYVQLAVRAAQQAGMSTLRVSFRGANLDGADVYHAGLTADIRATLKSPVLAGMQRIYLVGYSMGGHITLRYASEANSLGIDPRVRAVSSVCAPLDLRKGVDAIQRADRLLYQASVLTSLKTHYAAVDAKARSVGRTLPHTLREVQAVKTIFDWDRLVVCPRYAFPNIDTYYRECSVGPRLAAMELPTLMVVADADPMIPLATLQASMERMSPHVEVRRFDRGGHVAFPETVWNHDSVEHGIARWFLAQ